MREVTAGDLIRHELAKSDATVLGLAKLIAGSDDDRDPEVQRWRFVVHRANEGAEPNALNARQIAKVFGKDLERPRRQPRAVAHPGELEAEVRRLIADVDDLTGHFERLTARVELLERREPRESPRAGRR